MLPRLTLAPTLALLAVLATPGCGPLDDLGSDEEAVHQVCGGATTVPGIDVSTWQGAVSWTSVKSAGVVFAIARVSHGVGTIDDRFAANWPGMKKAGIIRGVYQYFQPDDDALAQANLLINKVQAAGGLDPADLPPVIDVENMGGLSSAAVIKAIGTWIARIKTALKRVPIIYTGSYFWDDHSLGSSFASYPLWTAHYTTACPLVPNAWSSWKLWQYTDKGSVAGIGGAVDRDRFNGDLAALKQLIASSIIGGTSDGGAPPPKLDGKPVTAADGGRTDASTLPPPPSERDGAAPGRDAIGNAPPPAATAEGGCSCRLAAKRPADPATAPLLFAAAIFLAGRRSRRRRRAT